MADEPKPMTVGELEDKVAALVQSAVDKQLTRKAHMACNHFFHNDDEGLSRNVPRAVANSHGYEHGKDYSYYNREVCVPINPQGTRLLSIIVNQKSRMSLDAHVKVILMEDGDTNVVLDAVGNSLFQAAFAGLAPQQINNDWGFKVYKPGDWEGLLDGEKLEELCKARQQF